MYFPHDGPNEMAQTVAVSVHNCCIPLNIAGKLSCQVVLQQECNQQWWLQGKSTCRIKGQHWWKLSNFFVKGKITNLYCLISMVSGEKICAQHSQTVYFRALDSQSLLICFDFLSQGICFKVTTGCDRDQHSLMQNNSSSLSDRILNTDMRTPSEFFFLQNLTNQV